MVLGHDMLHRRFVVRRSILGENQLALAVDASAFEHRLASLRFLLKRRVGGCDREEKTVSSFCTQCLSLGSHEVRARALHGQLAFVGFLLADFDEFARLYRFPDRHVVGR